MTHNRWNRRDLVLALLAVWCFSLSCLAQDARFVQELSPPLAVTIVPALVAQKPDNQLPYKNYETVSAKATRSYHPPGYNVRYFFVTYRSNNGQQLSGWTYQENATPISFVSPWLAETVVQNAYIAKKPSYVTMQNNHRVPAGSRYRVIGTWQEPRRVWYLLQDENTDYLHGWTESANIRQAGYLQQWAAQQRQEHVRQQQGQDNRVAMVSLFLLLYIGFGFWAAGQDAYRGYCAEKLSTHTWGVVGAMPISSAFFGLFLLMVLSGGLRGGSFWFAILFAASGSRAAFFLPASLKDLTEYARALFSEHPAEAQVRRVMGEKRAPSADEPVDIRRVKINLSDLPGIWESRYRERQLKELHKVVQSEQRVLDELRDYLRKKAKLEP